MAASETRGVTSICPNTGDVRFDYLLKEVAARFLHWQVTAFLCNEQLSYGHLLRDNVNILFFIVLPPPLISASTDDQ